MRTCTVANCGYPVFGTDKETGKGYCKSHQYLRTDKKKKTVKVKNSGQAEIFDQIWASEPHYSAVSGLSLQKYDKDQGSDRKFYYHCFAHVLPKGKYPDLKLDKDNIVLLTPDEHHLLDHGIEQQREEYRRTMETEGVYVDWSRVTEKKMKLLKQLIKKHEKPF